MRIPAAWWWIPAAVTLAGMIYLSLVKLSGYQAARNQPVVIREAPRPFTPPPVSPKHLPSLIGEPPAELAPASPASPSLPAAELPPFHPPKAK